MVKKSGLGKRKRFPEAEESEAPETATDSTQPPDESVSTQSASVPTHATVTTQSAQADFEFQAKDIEGELAIQEPT